jgi:hypothetical protein
MKGAFLMYNIQELSSWMAHGLAAMTGRTGLHSPRPHILFPLLSTRMVVVWSWTVDVMAELTARMDLMSWIVMFSSRFVATTGKIKQNKNNIKPELLIFTKLCFLFTKSSSFQKHKLTTFCLFPYLTIVLTFWRNITNISCTRNHDSFIPNHFFSHTLDLAFLD